MFLRRGVFPEKIFSFGTGMEVKRVYLKGFQLEIKDLYDIFRNFSKEWGNFRGNVCLRNRKG